MKKILTIIALTILIGAQQVKSQGCDAGNFASPFPQGSFGADYILGTMQTVTAPGTLTGLSLMGNAGWGSMAQMALYADNGGAPGALLATSSIDTLVTPGTNTMSVAPMAITAGNYWVMAIYNIGAGSSNCDNSSSKTVYYTSLPFGSPMPTNAAGFVSYGGQDFNYWMNITCGGGCPLPTVPVISGPSVICGITHPVYSATSTGATSYTWTTPSNLPTSNMVINSGQGTASITTSVTGSNLAGNVMCTATNSCGTTTAASYMVTKKPQTPASITGPTNICGMSTASYSIPTTFGATSYTWTVPAGMTLVSGAGTTGITVSIATTFTAGAVKVMAVNACGSIPGTQLLVYGKAAPSVITGPTNVCGMTSATYTCNTVPNASSYTWAVPLGWSIMSGQGTDSMTAMMPANVNNVTVSGAVKVYAVSGCGNSAVKSLTVSYCKSAISMSNGVGEEQGINVYPNPATDVFTLLIDNAQWTIDNGQLSMEIYNVLGEKMQSEAITNNQSTINISSLSKGMYFVRLIDADNNVLYTQRVIKQ